MVTDVRFDAAQLDGGIEDWLAKSEAKVPNLRPGAQKQVIWAGAPEVQTDWALVYVHGFSAAPQEIRPVPDMVAQGLGQTLSSPGSRATAATALRWQRPRSRAGWRTWPRRWPSGIVSGAACC
ncbi:hypothetical protein KU6B_17540 [Mameliella alba]|nr:hypothetical protein KU6B_17540 [Mameliella alba]